MRVTDDGLVAGRQLPDEEVTETDVSNLTQIRERGLRQRTIFEYAAHTGGTATRHGRPVHRTAIQVDQLASIPWGDPVATKEEVVDTDTFRLLSHNVNGLSSADQQSDVLHFANAIANKAVSIFGIQEPNRNFERQHVLTSFHRIITQVSTHHHGSVSSAKMQWPQDYQPGGTAVSIQNKWATRYLENGSDDLGRWSWLTIAGQGTTKITFISAYRVCDGAAEAAITSRTVRAQQEWIYADRGHSTVNLRQQFVTDLIVQLRIWKTAGHDLVVMLDANEPAGPGSAIDRLIYACNLTDAHIKENEDIAPPPTHQRGSQKIDFVLISERLVRAVKARAILPLHDGYLSDHRALLVDFDSRLLFAGPTSEVVAPSSRQLTSTNPKAVAKYTTLMLKQIAKHDVLHKVEHLRMRSQSGNWTIEDTKQWEIVDRIMAQARTFSENKCTKKKSGQMPWSPELKLSGETLLYWRLRIREHTSRKTNQNMLDTLAVSCSIAAEDIAWASFNRIRNKIGEAKKKHKQVKMDAEALREQYMTDQAQFIAALHGMSDVAARAAIAAREKSSNQFRTLRRIFRGGRSGGLERLDVPNQYAVLRPNEAVPRIPLVTKEAIEAALLPHTEKRIRQHSETPFGHGERCAAMGQDCSSADFASLQHGTYDRDLESLSDEARVWLGHLKQKEHVAEGNLISTHISTDDWIQG